MTTGHHSRLHFIEVPFSHQPARLCEVVAEGLSAPQKRLPCRYFYDSTGSRLFERICELPEYYLTRTERTILECSAAEIVEAAGRDLVVIEFGSGSSLKTRLLLNAVLNRQSHLQYIPIDISSDFLRVSALDLLRDYDRLNVTAIAAEYNDGIEAIPDHDHPRLLLFLGSNIGNFEHAEAVEFLKRIRKQMRHEDRLLIGIDLLKDHAVLQAAYNDTQGVTALFNKNLLVRINRELGGNFDLNAFDHHAPFVETQGRIEMRLISRHRRTVNIAAMESDFRFEQGEYIHTENSHKYSPGSFTGLCLKAGWEIQERWLDAKEWFAVVLLKPVPLPDRRFVEKVGFAGV